MRHFTWISAEWVFTSCYRNICLERYLRFVQLIIRFKTESFLALLNKRSYKKFVVREYKNKVGAN